MGLRDYGTGTWEGGDEGCDHARPTTTYNAGFNDRWGQGAGMEKQEQKSNGQYGQECPKCGARRIDSQIGLESSPDEWAARLVDVFREVRRVLRDDGTLWVECGDSYSAQPGQRKTTDKAGEKQATNAGSIGAPSVSVEGMKPKDLIGQPWKLAQALRDPYYAGAIKDERDRVWLAATIDAEGCIAGNRHVRKDNGSVRTAVHVSITNTNRLLLDKAQRIWPASRQQHDPRRSSMGQRECWRWVANDVDRNALLMRELYPYLIAKRVQARLAYNLFEMSRVSKRTGKLAEGVQARERRDWIVAALSDLNQGRDVDIPAWCVEPPSLYEPGWYLRSCIIWAKPNCMPESVTDRPTTAHSYVFLFSKRPRYFYDAEALREPHDDKQGHWTRSVNGAMATGEIPGRKRGESKVIPNDVRAYNPAGKNARSVWTIPTEPNALAICRVCDAFWQGGAPREHCGQPVVQHFAAFPRELVRRMILAGTSERGVCAECGAPWVREVAETFIATQARNDGKRYDDGNLPGRTEAQRSGWKTSGITSATTLGWRPSCNHDASPIPATILDPFAGSGTSLLVARQLGRHAIGIELNERYAAMCKARMSQLSLLA